MLSKKMEDALNEQINAELYSSYLYLAMAAWFQEANFVGFAAWMRAQAKEEEAHAMKIYDYILERNGHVSLRPVAAPGDSFGSPLKIFEAAYKHEQSITARIHKLAELAAEEHDRATALFLQWFISEQVEEEKNAASILDLLEKVGSSMGALYQVDHNLGKRGE